MKLSSLLLVLTVVSSVSAYADIRPKSDVKFYCSDDKTQLLVTDGTTISPVESSIEDWSSGLPKGGCSQDMINSVTNSGYYCDGHWLYHFNGGQQTDQDNSDKQEFADSPSCQQALASEPSVKWN